MFDAVFTSSTGQSFAFGYKASVLWSCDPLGDLPVDLETSQGYQQVGAPVESRSIGHGPVYPGRAIGAGSVGPDVAQVETWLNGRSCLYCTEGYVTENRCFGPEETAAVRLAQQRAGLLVTGTVDRGTWAALQAQSCPHCSKEE